jgi:hypothetical protein
LRYSILNIDVGELLDRPYSLLKRPHRCIARSHGMSLILHCTHEEERGINHVLGLIHLANLDDQSWPTPNIWTPNHWCWRQWGMLRLDHRCEFICELRAGLLSKAMIQVPNWTSNKPHIDIITPRSIIDIIGRT